MHVFLSHSSQDKRWADELTAKLKSLDVPVWNADWELLPGQNVALQTGKALEHSNALVVLISPSAVNTPAVRNEIDYALVNERFEDRLIPVIVKTAKRMPWILEELDPIQLHNDCDQAARRIKKALDRKRAAKSNASS